MDLNNNNMDSPQIAVITVPISEWNALNATVQSTAQQVQALTNREQKELLTPAEVCEMLKISRSTYERYINDGVIEVHKVSKKKYTKNLIRREHIEDLIRNGKV